MAVHIYLCGHGSWKGDNGFTLVPKGASLGFIGMHAKTVYTDAMIEACKGTYDDKLSDEFEELRSVPNMTWSPDEQWKVDKCKTAADANPKPALSVFPERTTTLKAFFESEDVCHLIREAKVKFGKVRFIWSCCRYVEMKGQVKGKEGFNATHDLVGKDLGDVPHFHFRDRTDGGKIIKSIPVSKTR